MKKAFLILMAALLLIMTGCEATQPTQTEPEPEGSRVEHYTRVCVDISVHEDGFYGTWADVDLHYYAGKLSSISISDPTLLAFKVSSRYENGVYILSGSEGGSIAEVLEESAKMAEYTGNAELLEKLTAAIELIERSGPLEEAST